MKKEEFYMTGFYCLIGIIIGFCIGSIIEHRSNEIQYIQQKESTDTVVAVSNTLDSISDKVLYEHLKSSNIQHPNIVLAQAKLETGNFTSEVYKKHNNLFGLRKGNTYYSFNHWKDSVQFYKDNIQSRYKGGDYFAFLNKIGYAEDHLYTIKVQKIVNSLNV